MPSCTLRGNPRDSGRRRSEAGASSIPIAGRRSQGGLRGTLLPGFAGLSLFGIALLGLPLNTYHLSQFQALNHELGKLCARPPVEAQAVCRLHARLVSSL